MVYTRLPYNYIYNATANALDIYVIGKSPNIVLTGLQFWNNSGSNIGSTLSVILKISNKYNYQGSRNQGSKGGTGPPYILIGGALPL